MTADKNETQPTLADFIPTFPLWGILSEPCRFQTKAPEAPTKANPNPSPQEFKSFGAGTVVLVSGMGRKFSRWQGHCHPVDGEGRVLRQFMGWPSADSVLLPSPAECEQLDAKVRDPKATREISMEDYDAPVGFTLGAAGVAEYDAAASRGVRTVPPAGQAAKTLPKGRR